MSVRAPEAVLWDFLCGAMRTRALGIVAELGIADALTDGPRAVEDLARETGADPDSLQRILRALASDGVFSEESPGVFRNTEASESLRRGDPNGDFARLFGGIWHRAVGSLDARAEEEAAFPRTFGVDLWTWLSEHPEERATFDRAMQAGSMRRADRLDSLEWRGDETVVDVGGGNGSLLRELLRRRPGLRGIVLDLPETDRDEAAFGDRIEFVPGSFFESVPEGDVYVLGTVLHDWDDEHAGAILRTIQACAPSYARVAILDSVIPPGNEPHGAKWLDLLMLTLFRGRERTEAEWRAVVEGAGLAVETIEDGLIQASCP